MSDTKAVSETRAALYAPQEDYEKQVVIVDGIAYCDKRTFEQLPLYQATLPTGQRIGKMWLTREGQAYKLHKYYALPEDPDCVREIGIRSYPLYIEGDLERLLQNRVRMPYGSSRGRARRS